MKKEPVIYGMLAEFGSEEAVLEAAHKVHEAGYQRAEGYTPFAVEGLAEALGSSRTRVAAMTFWFGILGACVGFGMCWYANVISYPWNIGGRPPNSWPAWIPITFELMVLGASMGALLAMLGLNGLPQPYHPVFNAPPFQLASKDRFFLCIEAKDPKYDTNETRKFFEALSPISITEVPE
ncbi:MAG TPA: DUF3341 domain-containing protein [Tepidisphaeraceae bacterium]|nr:DUF3341 domain-containing protein [Tepidisphaeraceae bacterium]